MSEEPSGGAPAKWRIMRGNHRTAGVLAALRGSCSTSVRPGCPWPGEPAIGGRTLFQIIQQAQDLSEGLPSVDQLLGFQELPSPGHPDDRFEDPIRMPAESD